jgi:glucose/mannose-6-phosphate isomerase
MAASLDDTKNLRAFDTGNMLEAIAEYPQNARKAIRAAEKLSLDKLESKKITGLIIAGMGGSAVGGLLLRDWLRDRSLIPIQVSRGYSLPAWVNENTLVYAVSYSGNTEETLSQYREAMDRGCPTICFSSGGKLRQSASLEKVPQIIYPKGYQARAAITYQLFSIASVSRRLGIIDDETWSQVDEALKVLKDLSRQMKPDSPTSSNPAKRLAESIKDYIPFVYGGEAHETVTYRYTTQFNENSKCPASHNFIPEAFHNSIMAREASRDLLSRCCAVIIRDSQDGRLSLKMDKFTELISESFGKVIEVEATGEGKLARIISALYIGDFASAYLAILYGKDPSSTDSILSIKQIALK